MFCNELDPAGPRITKLCSSSGGGRRSADCRDGRTWRYAILALEPDHVAFHGLASPFRFPSVILLKSVHVKVNRRPHSKILVLVAAAGGIGGCHGMHGLAGYDGVLEGFERSETAGSGFVHATFYRRIPSPDGPPGKQPLFVYFEGDGRPWNSSGTAPRRNPDPRRGLALEFAAMQDGDAAVLGRPCYFGHAKDPGCNPDLWTDARYSEPVVASMATALRTLARRHAPSPLVLVGYSGGGSLALLVANRLPEVKAVVTVAANLDLDGWVEYHGYRPLASSLDPLKTRDGAPGCEIHIAAERDAVVPIELSRHAVAQRPTALFWVEGGADHTCCWTNRWPELMDRIRRQLESSHCFADRSQSRPQFDR